MKKLSAILAAATAALACFAMTGCQKFDVGADWEYMQKKGDIIVGYTVYEPFAYTENNTLVGFDVELAQKVAEKLGVTVKFQEIHWDAKVTELNTRNIDVIWNAMTITEELKPVIDMTAPYMNNSPAAVVKAENAAKYATKELVRDAGVTIAVEGGSSGALAVQNDETLKNVTLLSCPAQINTFTEVASGTSEIAVVDAVLFAAHKNNPESTVSKNNLVRVEGITFPAEVFGIGVRKGSNFLAILEDALAELKEQGVYDQLAAKYELTGNLIR